MDDKETERLLLPTCIYLTQHVWTQWIDIIPGKGGYFGELALVTHKPRAASAYAAGPTKVACEWQFSFITNQFPATE